MFRIIYPEDVTAADLDALDAGLRTLPPGQLRRALLGLGMSLRDGKAVVVSSSPTP